MKITNLIIPAAQQMVLDKAMKIAALAMKFNYLNRYYGVKFDDVNIKELMLFLNLISTVKMLMFFDRLIEIGSKENNISGSRTYDALWSLSQHNKHRT